MWDAPNVMGENSLSLKSLKIPDTVKNIGPCAFMNCSNLERVDFPKTAYIKLCRFAFCYCNKLKEITLYGANVGVFCFLIEKKLKRIELNDVNTYYFGDGAANHFTEANTIVLNGNTECWLSHFHLDSHVNRIFLNDSATLNWGDILTTVGRVYVNGIFSKIPYMDRVENLYTIPSAKVISSAKKAHVTYHVKTTGSMKKVTRKKKGKKYQYSWKPVKTTIKTYRYKGKKKGWKCTKKKAATQYYVYAKKNRLDDYQLIQTTKKKQITTSYKYVKVKPVKIWLE